MRYSSRAIIIQDKKLLLLTGHGADFYWTPGGGIEAGETADDALRREVKEELGVYITGFKHYLSYEHDDQSVTSYLVSINEPIKIDNEITGYIWYTKGDTDKLSKGLESVLLPRLTEDGLL